MAGAVTTALVRTTHLTLVVSVTWVQAPMQALRGNRQQGRMSHHVPRQRTAHAVLAPLAAVVQPELVGTLLVGKFWICWGAHEFGGGVWHSEHQMWRYWCLHCGKTIWSDF